MEGGSTYIGGVGAKRLLPDSIKQDVAVETITIIAATGANTAVDKAPGVAKAVSQEITDLGAVDLHRNLSQKRPFLASKIDSLAAT